MCDANRGVELEISALEVCRIQRALVFGPSLTLYFYTFQLVQTLKVSFWNAQGPRQADLTSKP